MRKKIILLLTECQYLIAFDNSIEFMMFLLTLFTVEHLSNNIIEIVTIKTIKRNYYRQRWNKSPF